MVRPGTIDLRGEERVEKAMFVTGCLGLSFKDWLCRIAAALQLQGDPDPTRQLPDLQNDPEYQVRITTATWISHENPDVREMAKVLLGSKEYMRATKPRVGLTKQTKTRISVPNGEVSINFMPHLLVNTLDEWAQIRGLSRNALVRQLLEVQYRSLMERITPSAEMQKTIAKITPYSLVNANDSLVMSINMQEAVLTLSPKYKEN